MKAKTIKGNINVEGGNYYLNGTLLNVSGAGVVHVASLTAPNVSNYKAGDIWIKTNTGQKYHLYDAGAFKVWFQPVINSRYHIPEWMDWFVFVEEGLIEATDVTPITIDGTAYTPQQLVDNDYPNIIVKYDNQAPHHIRMYGLLKPELVGTLSQQQLDTLHEVFDLWTWWSGVWNDYSVMKANRPLDGPLEQVVYTATGAITNISDGVTHNGTHFLVPVGVTSFTFEDNAVSRQGVLNTTTGVWEFTNV